MDTDAETSELQQQTAAEHRIQRIQFLSCLIIACQQKLEMAAEVFALAQRMLAEARDQLEVAQKALERAGADI